MVTITREDIPIRILASGTALKIPVFHVKGSSERPKVYIQANIHGPEIAGIGAIYDLLAFLRQQSDIKGSLIIVPSVNPVGLDSKIDGKQVGYADLNETIVGNFNRIYQMPVHDKPPVDPEAPRKLILPEFVEQHKDSDLETIKSAFRSALKQAYDEMDAHSSQYGRTHGEKLASIIQHMAYDADYVIDLHTAGDALYHMFTFSECLNSVPYFNLRYTILLDDNFSGVLDESFLQPWKKLQVALKQAGRDIPFSDFELEAFTAEFGSEDTLQRHNMYEDAMRIVNYLRYKRILPGDAVRYGGIYYYTDHKHYRSYRATTGGLLLWNQDLGAHLTSGDQIASIIRPYAIELGKGESTENVVSVIDDGILINRTQSHVIQEGLSICSLMTRVKQFDGAQIVEPEQE